MLNICSCCKKQEFFYWTNHTKSNFHVPYPQNLQKITVYAKINTTFMINPILLTTLPSKDYALIDSGDGEKLERYGTVVLSRPDPQALWPKQKPEQWNKRDGEFTRSEKSAWEFRTGVPSSWEIVLADIKFKIRPSAFKHTGVFPEQAPNWDWMRYCIRKANRPISVLNLFGYTGGATLACAQAGASVCHIDGSKVAIGWARENAQINSLQDKPIRWILDDAVKFVKREIKRGRKYDAIIMDPPAFGHGPEKELWKIEDNFIAFIELCAQLLSDDPLFVLLNGYASGYSSLAYLYNLQTMMQKYNGDFQMGELTIAQENSQRLLPCGIFARWEKK